MSKQTSSTSDVIRRQLDLESIVLDPRFKTRKEDHEEAGVERIAKSFMYRYEHGIAPVQVNDVIVMADDESDKFYLVDGEGRYKAALLVNELGGLDEKPMQLWAKIVKATDPQQALITGLQANFHDAIDVFDMAEVASKLAAGDGDGAGLKQKEIAQILNVSEGRVSQLMPLAKIPKKYVQAYKDGDIDSDSVIAIANMDADDPARQEIMEGAIKHRQRLTEILARREHKQKKEELAAQILEAKGKVSEFEQTAKALDKQIKEVEKQAAETKNKKDLEKVRKEKEKLEAERKASEKALRDAAKELERAKAAKEKLAESPVVKKARATVEDVKNEAAAKGVQGPGTKSARSKSTFIAELEAMGEDEKNPLPESATMLIGRIEGFLDGDYTATQLRNAFVKACRDNDEYARAKK